jgi:hypothetical protein
MKTKDQLFESVRQCAEVLDTKVAGWAFRVPLSEVDVSRTERSPLAFVIGMSWDDKITAASAMGMGAFTLYSAEAEILNRAWQAEIATRRSALAKAS